MVHLAPKILSVHIGFYPLAHESYQVVQTHPCAIQAVENVGSRNQEIEPKDSKDILYGPNKIQRP